MEPIYGGPHLRWWPERSKVIDWGLVARVAGGGFGVTVLVLVILSVVIWVTGLVAGRLEPKGEDTK